MIFSMRQRDDILIIQSLQWLGVQFLTLMTRVSRSTRITRISGVFTAEKYPLN
jgi:hypothetical protein